MLRLSNDLELEVLNLKSERIISSLCFDSRQIRKDSVFFAFNPIAGGRNGSDFIADAISKSVTMVVCPKNPLTLELARLNPQVTFLLSPNPQRLYSRFCSISYGEPGIKLKIIGVTGTDGKTSTCDFLYQILKRHKVNVAILSTVSMDDGSGIIDSPYRQSTPEAEQLNAFFSRCVKNKVSYVILEATSHALSTQTSRLADILFEGAVFTSISSEHLEFHHTLTDYVDSKLNLARQTRPDGFVLYPDSSEYKMPICDAFKGERKIEYGSQVGSEVDYDLDGCTFDGIVFPYGEPVFLQNAIGALKAASLILKKDIPLSELGYLKPVKGRMRVVRTKDGDFIVDFAHTADAYRRIFSFVNSVCPSKKLNVVFSSGGHRDVKKRSDMGKIASEYCTTMILSSEDPRDEGFESITADILREVNPDDVKILLLPDRAEAIAEAVRISDDMTITLLLGKGHEKTIEFENGRKIAWDEMAVLQEALNGK